MASRLGSGGNYRLCRGRQRVNVEAAYNLFKDRAFSDVAAFQRLCPTMGSATPKLHSVHLYHGLLQLSSALGAARWAKSEMELCARRLQPPF